VFIAMIFPECGPVAKVGGLADVVFGLSRELEANRITTDSVGSCAAANV
jgi:glycogen synthase